MPLLYPSVLHRDSKLIHLAPTDPALLCQTLGKRALGLTSRKGSAHGVLKGLHHGLACDVLASHRTLVDDDALTAHLRLGYQALGKHGRKVAYDLLVQLGELAHKRHAP